MYMYFLIPFKLLSSLYKILHCYTVKVASGKVRDRSVFKVSSHEVTQKYHPS